MKTILTLFILFVIADTVPLQTDYLVQKPANDTVKVKTPKPSNGFD